MTTPTTFTHQEAGIIIGVSPRTVAAMVKDGRLAVSESSGRVTVWTMAEHLGVSVQELMDILERRHAQAE